MSQSERHVPRGAKFATGDRLLILHPPGDVLATVLDTPDTWLVRWSPDVGWSCSCPVKTTSCGHILAVRRVIVLDTDPAEDSPNSSVGEMEKIPSSTGLSPYPERQS